MLNVKYLRTIIETFSFINRLKMLSNVACQMLLIIPCWRSMTSEMILWVAFLKVLLCFCEVEWKYIIFVKATSILDFILGICKDAYDKKG